MENKYYTPEIEEFHVGIEYKSFEKIADDFAVEFAEWFDDMRVDNYPLYESHSVVELLEIFKENNKL
jgi:hypothetical protein